mgnify:CR=1 FL=1
MNKKIKVNKNKKGIFFLFDLFILNIKTYGFFITFLIGYYELIYSFIDNFKYFKSSTLHNYIKIKKSSKSYDTPYIPTPYYFLKVIEKQMIKIGIKDFTFIDFGCGPGRVTNYFKNIFKIAIGIDKNKNYKKFSTSPKQKFIHLNLRNLNKLNKIEKNIIGNRALYFNEPFDIFLVIKIIKLFLKRKRKCLVITTNTKIIKIKDLKVIFLKKFNNKENLRIYECS